ncbi:MAG TPA: hypothetical protein VGM52_06715 [Herbaspirillum sp.]|jgi:hypothetical protein
MSKVIQAVNNLITADAASNIRTYIKQHFPNAKKYSRRVALSLLSGRRTAFASIPNMTSTRWKMLLRSFQSSEKAQHVVLH